MSKYDSLGASSELEQAIAADLTKALGKRGLEVRHNGTEGSHAPGGRPDIEVWDSKIHINVEVTKSTRSSQDREWQPIKDHFENAKRDNPGKKCFLIFVSPETYYRTINSVQDWNFAHKSDADQKMLPLCFPTFEIIVRRLIENPKEVYTKNQIVALFNNFSEFVDDENVLRHVFETLFPTDAGLKEQVVKNEEERHQRVVQELVSGFKQLEQKLRDERVALSGDAIKNVIYLVFIKLYEEKKEKEEQKRNRFTLKTFQDYQEYVRDTSKAIHRLFSDIKNDKQLKDCGLLTAADELSGRLRDEFVIEHFIKPFEKYAFFTTKVDGLGAAYEVLGELSGKDVKVGQFFTPENAVKFMVKLAELSPDDVVYDPACGTARFLTNAMQDMLDKVKGKRNEDLVSEHIRRQQLFGTDDDPTVAKLAKMNMYIHGDGKTNIKDEDGLTQYDFDGRIDVILTNPPLGDLDYWRSIYDDEFRLERMQVIPKRNLTEEKMARFQQRLDHAKAKGERTAKIENYMATQTDGIAECRLLIERGESAFKTAGKQMKGGALFTNASWHYLKNVRDSGALSEWKGGKLLVILDEGILNTDNYRDVRTFIKKHFYIKAIISLTRDTFVPVSKTSTKTSILYAIKKTDLDATQKEPIFYAHAEKVGVNTRKKTCPNHLFNDGHDILSKYREFENAVLSSYEGGIFDKKKFLAEGFQQGTIR